MEKLAVFGGKPIRGKPLGKWPIIGDEEKKVVIKVLESGKLFVSMYSGDQVPKFEEEFASVMGVDHAVAVSSGSAALDIVLRAIGIDVGDEVIATPYTFIATATSIFHNDGIPVFADVDIRTRNIDPSEIKRKLLIRQKLS
ncbi:MAG: hypothetical protein B6U94_02145 [Thermofilum sp. ex4484_79]|nr:MAG: hypothetical protein B6U94_02145 [Thermofilum sp. ex4484_79]